MKTVTIIGKAPSGASCPFEGEVWGINETPPLYPGKRFDKIFSVDPLKPEGVALLKSFGSTIVSVQSYADEPYPLAEVKAKFGQTYFMASLAYAIAYALLKGYEKIILYGCDHKMRSEYLRGKGSVEYWIGRAHGMGVEVWIQKESDLLKNIQTFSFQVITPANEKVVTPARVFNLR